MTAPQAHDPSGLSEPARAGWTPAAVVAVLATLPFLPTLQGAFLNWDDAPLFLENPHYRGFGWAQVKWAFTTFHMGHYMPLSWLIWELDYMLSGTNPIGYHLTSLLLHAAAAIACYCLSLRLLRLALPSATECDLRLGAAAAALFWAVHPLRVESVAWATELRDVLSGLFYISAVIAYLKAVAADDGSRSGWYWRSFALFAGAVLSKSITVTLPAALLVLDVYPLRRLGPGRWLDRRVWLEKLPFVALTAIAGVIAFIAIRGIGNQPSWQVMGLLPRLIFMAYGLSSYVFNTLAPFALSPLYPLYVLITWFHLGGALAGAMVAAAAWRRWPALTAVSVFYFVTLLPVSGLFHNGPQAAADRYTYVSCLGWAMLVGALAAWRWTGARVVRTVLAAWLIALMALTWQQTGVWHDSVTLWSRVISLYPDSALAHFNLGGFYEGQGRYAEALAEYQEVLRLSRNNAYWYITIGWAWEKTGVSPGAERAFREALRLRPGLPDACVGLARVLERMGKRPERSKGCPPPEQPKK
jgi:tetratricopeptide (TPR) repeat protein